MPTVTKSAATLQTKRQAIPDILIASPFKRRAFISDISVLVDPSFVRFGAMRVELEGVKIHETMPGELGTVQSFKIQTSGREVPRQAEIHIWVWSPAGNPVSATFVMAVELTAQAASQALVAASQTELNALVADTLELEVNTAEAWAARARDFVDLGRPARELVYSGVTGDVLSMVDHAGRLGFDLAYQRLLAGKIAGFRGILLGRAQAQFRRGSAPAGRTRDNITMADFEPWISQLEALGHELAALHETLPEPQTADRSLFPFTVYTDVSHARLINLKGARNMIVSLVASEIDPPTQVLPNPAPVPADPPISFSADGRPQGDTNYVNGVAHIRDTSALAGSHVYARAIYDMVNPYDTTMRPSFAGGTQAATITSTAGEPRAYLGWVTYSPPRHGSDPARYKPYYVTPTWAGATEAYELDGPNWATSRRLTCEYRDGRWRAGDMTKRYLGIVRRVRLTGWNQRQGRTTTYLPQPPAGGIVMYSGSLDGIDVRDDVSHGGAGKVSFEVRDNRGTWRELIPARAITQGADQVVRYGAEQGDHTLPSGPNILRARLTVTNGLQTGVSVIVVE